MDELRLQQNSATITIHAPSSSPRQAESRPPGLTATTMDFFSVVPDPATHPSLPCNPAPIDSFAEAIAHRFGSASMLTTVRLNPPSLTPTPPRPPPAASSSAESPFTPIPPAAVQPWIDDPIALIVDIRPHAAHSSARLPRALSLSVPSTLLKRPLFSLQRLSAMLPSVTARNRFSAWKSASRILVYDADSAAIPDSSNIHGLLRKFKSDGFQGELAWLQGGFHAVWRERRELVDTHPPTPDVENDEDEDDETIHNAHEGGDLDKPSPRPNAVLRTRHLPMSAFNLSSTTVHNSPHFNPAVGPHSSRRLPSASPHRPPQHNSNALALSTPSHPAFNPFFDTIRQNVELSHGITERIPLRLPRRVRRRIHELPFPWLQAIARRAAKAQPHQHRPLDSASSASEESEDDDSSADPADVEEGTEALAMQFYRIELAEQRRLMGIMEHHSKESGTASEAIALAQSMLFPFSITAGVEKGAKNRYRHIWPFEHARVRLHQKCEADDDYVNASYVQPLGTSKRYIATQGPLPATYIDFWTLCWEQNVHVIVMLTREIEGSMVKCGNYWADSAFGPLRLRLVSTAGIVPLPEEPTFNSSFFPPRLSSHSSRPHNSTGHYPNRRPHHHHTSETIKRVFELSHTGHPDAKPRKIIHLQYLDWPDMNVPEDPRGLLGLIREVDAVVKETGARDEAKNPSASAKPAGRMEIDEKTGISKHAMGKNSPVLLHCSAGVGRTGGFIAVDAVLDAIRREVRINKGKIPRHAPEADAMDVDVSSNGATVQQGTAPITVSDGGGHAAGLVVHVPIAGRDGLKTPMQVDSEGPEPETSESEKEHSRERPGSAFGPNTVTRKWAENVREETGVGSPSLDTNQSQHAHQLSTASATSTTRSSPSADTSTTSTSKSQGSEYSLFGKKQFGSYYHPSSSLRTSVSGASSTSSKASSSPPFPETPSSAPGLMLPAFSGHRVADASLTADPRLRTFSAPSRGKAQQAVATKHHANTIGAVGAPHTSSSSMQWLPNDRKMAASPMTVDQSRSSYLSPSPVRASAHGGLSSDGEPPSRSQSPSADEASTGGADVSAQIFPPQSHTATTVSAIPSQHDTTQWVAENKVVDFSKTFDYKEPRPLHEDFSPPPLTTLEEPIWEVVQDMREQRMSLCQSLRQYVFVHAAIIEGALMVIDEENEEDSTTPPTARDASMSTTFSLGHHSTTSRPLQTDGSDSVSSASTGKRAASPTELLKEGRGGELLLSKRPSIKRKQRSGDDKEDTSRSAPFQRAQAQLAAGSSPRSHSSPSRIR